MVNNSAVNSLALRGILTPFLFLIFTLTYPHVLQQSEKFLVTPILRSRNHENSTIIKQLFPLPQQVPAYLPSSLNRKYLYSSALEGLLNNSSSIISFLNQWINRSEKHIPLSLIEHHCTKIYLPAQSIIKSNNMSKNKLQSINSHNSSEMHIADTDHNNKKRTKSNGNSQQYTKTPLISTALQEMEVDEAPPKDNIASVDNQNGTITSSTDPATTYTNTSWNQITQLLEPFRQHEPEIVAETTGTINARTRLRNRHAALLAEAATRGLVLDDLDELHF